MNIRPRLLVLVLTVFDVAARNRCERWLREELPSCRKRSNSIATSARSFRTTATPATGPTRTSGKPTCGWTRKRACSVRPGTPASLFPASRTKANSGGESAPRTTIGCRPLNSERCFPIPIGTPPPLDRAGGEMGGALGLFADRPPAAAGLEAGPRSRKTISTASFCKALDEHGLDSVARGRSGHAVATAALRFDRIAAVDRGGGRIRRRFERDRRTKRSSTGCWARPNSASGWRCGGSTWSVTPTASAITATSRSASLPSAIT